MDDQEEFPTWNDIDEFGLAVGLITVAVAIIDVMQFAEALSRMGL